MYVYILQAIDRKSRTKHGPITTIARHMPTENSCHFLRLGYSIERKRGQNCSVEKLGRHDDHYIMCDHQKHQFSALRPVAAAVQGAAKIAFDH